MDTHDSLITRYTYPQRWSNLQAERAIWWIFNGHRQLKCQSLCDTAFRAMPKLPCWLTARTN